MVSSLRLAGALVAGAALAAPLAAQKNIPATYAITNARIVPLSGPVIEKGTIVIRGGVIAAVGAAVTAPADARIVDGSGLTVYPGLIDAYGTLGQATAAPANGAGGAGGRGGAAAAPAAPARLSNYGVGLQPELSVVDELAPSESAFDAAHAAGITTALTGNGNGIFRGQSAVINLIGDDASTMIVKAGVAQNIGFARGGGRGGYPGSLMGAFAALRQELLDAQHYRDVKNAYEKSPRGMARPDFDPSLEALQPVINGTQPVIMLASAEREIIRALDLAKEFKLKAVIAGGSEAYKVTARLKAENVPVLLSMNFPRRGAAGAAAGGGFGGGGRGGAGNAEDPEPMATLRARVQAPKTPGLLAAAGVKVAFQSGADFANLLGNLRKAVTAGLPADQALRAMTTAPAELFGVSDRLGTIEVGKIANLTITRGELLDSAGHVTQLFVDGKPVAVSEAPAAAPAGGRGGRGGGGFDASGRWTVSVMLDGRERTVRLSLLQDIDLISGVIEGDLGSAQLFNGEIGRDGSIWFTAVLSVDNKTAEAEFSGTLDRSGIHGSVDVEGHKTGSFAGSHN
ncbi:MAG: amidohydrolase family protein [Gemmatimonadota bacterium]